MRDGWLVALVLAVWPAVSGLVSLYRSHRRYEQVRLLTPRELEAAEFDLDRMTDDQLQRYLVSRVAHTGRCCRATRDAAGRVQIVDYS